MAKFWIADQFAQYLGTAIIDLEDSTFNLALVDSTLASEETAWATATAYTAGNVRMPTSGNRNGHRYICTVAGTSHATTEPTWPTTDDATVTDGTVTWAEYGGDLCSLDIWADASGSEVANGSGYTTGGETLTTLSLTTTYSDTVWDADDVTFSSLTKTFRYAFLYMSGTVDGIVNPIVGYILYDEAFADKSVSGIDWWTQISSSGIYTFDARA